MIKSYPPSLLPHATMAYTYNGHVVEDQEVTEGEFSMAWGALFDGYLNTHSLHCKSSDDDDRK